MDTSEEYIKVAIVHPTVHVEVGEYDVFMNDFHLCTLETARSQ